MLRLPIAVPHDEQHSRTHAFETPWVEGAEGDNLPALLGLKSISGHAGVVETEHSKSASRSPARVATRSSGRLARGT